MLWKYLKQLGPGITEKGGQHSDSVPMSTRRQPSNPCLRLGLLGCQLVDIGMKLHSVHFAVKFSSALALALDNLTAKCTSCNFISSRTKSNQVALSPISSWPRLATFDLADLVGIVRLETESASRPPSSVELFIKSVFFFQVFRCVEKQCQCFLCLESWLVCSGWTRVRVSTREGVGWVGIPQDKTRIRKGYSLITDQLRESCKLFRFREGFILPALYSPELLEDDDDQNRPNRKAERHLNSGNCTKCSMHCVMGSDIQT